jgi:hypothetical protein
VNTDNITEKTASGTVEQSCDLKSTRNPSGDREIEQARSTEDRLSSTISKRREGRYRQDNSSLESGEIPEIHEESRDYADEEHEDHQKRIDVDHHVDRGKDTPRLFNKQKGTRCKGQAANRPNPNP